MTDAIRPDTCAVFLADTQLLVLLLLGDKVGSLEAPLCLMNHQEDTQDSADSGTHSYNLLWQKDTEQDQQREKTQGENWGNQAQASKNPSQWSV